MTNVSGSDARASTIGSPRHANQGVHGVASVAEDYSTPRPSRTVVLTQADVDVFNAGVEKAASADPGYRKRPKSTRAT